jgi:4-amino-4-deoxy-L-arabinose transferase-like glycosyltransferase
VRSNRYVYFLTVFRSPWIYLEMLPQVLWTLAPSLAVLAARWNDRPRRSRALALLLWIAAVLGAHVVLGAIGYSKVLRYVILVTPPAVALVALAVDGLVRSWRERTRRTGGRALALGLAIFLAAGAGLELARSLKTTFDDNRRLDLIRPLTGLRGMDFGRPKTTR